MPDFRKAIEDASYKPQYEQQSTSGPDAAGNPATWRNPDQLTQSSAQELANLLGAQLDSVSMGGPFTQQKPQWQLDFGGPDTYDASLVYDQYQRAPELFNQRRIDEMKSSGGPSVSAAEFAGGLLNGSHGAGGPGGGGTGAGGTGTGTGGAGTGAGGTGTVKGPNDWKPSPSPNTPGPIVPTTPLPGATGQPLTTTVGNTVAGGYSVPGVPTNPIPDSMRLNTPYAKSAVTYNPRNDETSSRGMYPTGLLSPNATFDPIPKQTLANNGLLGLVKPDGTPLTPAEILAFGKSKTSLQEWLANKNNGNLVDP